MLKYLSSIEKKIDRLLYSSATRDDEIDDEIDDDSIKITPEEINAIKQWLDSMTRSATTHIILNAKTGQNVLVRSFFPYSQIGNHWNIFIANENDKKVYQGFVTINENGADVILGSNYSPSDDEGQFSGRSSDRFRIRRHILTKEDLNYTLSDWNFGSYDIYTGDTTAWGREMLTYRDLENDLRPPQHPSQTDGRSRGGYRGWYPKNRQPGRLPDFGRPGL